MLTNLDGYKLFHTPSNTRKGGTAMYINSNYDVFERNDLKSQTDLFETVWAEIKNTNSKNILCACVYRHPNNDLSDFLVYLEAALNTVMNKNKEIYICGDFNINLLKLDEN